ncbi:terpenoid cyclases/protein prenyltransferase alpha-alpha toroid [Mycena galericulata]|nr:terpenoid cyclases/protein prenyltransferase alpha-alpha toroid [Mycena galericulata]
MYSRLAIRDSPSQPFTDYSRWRLLVSESGRHTWHYLKTDEECAEWPQNSVDKFWLGLDLNYPPLSPAKDALAAARNGYRFYKTLQSHDGHWPGEYGGPMFLLPGLVIGSYVSGMDFKLEERQEMIRYLMNRANPEDGGWGMCVRVVHFRSTGLLCVVATSKDTRPSLEQGLNYTALRLLGMDADHPVCTKARATLHSLGGATAIPAWGKFWLSLLNVYDWEGNNPVPPELWLLPEWLPFHPHRWWIQTRTVYVPMSYLYGVRFKMPENDLILALRQELYPENYYSINWPAQRNNLIMLEDENTGYQTLAPVSKMFNLVARVYAEGPESEAYRLHKNKRDDFMWMGAEGMMMCGTNGSQLWDVAFITQALVETGLAELPENQESLIKALEWLEDGQILDHPKHYKTSYRHGTKGAWGFSTKEQGYVVSDCTGEGLKAVLYLQKDLSFTPKLISDRRIFDAADLLLTLQNPNGGFASYELIRGPKWLEYLNPAEECTTSVITSLSIFRKHYPEYRAVDISRTIKAAIVYLHGCQQSEGGWVGSWGICFTYATQFALESLALVGETYETSESSRRACEFLIRKQRADGGWGESYKSCEVASWIEHADSQVVQTCCAVMALMYARYPHAEPLERGVALVMSRQLPDGSWPQEAIEGVFNKTCAIAYPNFKFSFPIWMLGKAHEYLKAGQK